MTKLLERRIRELDGDASIRITRPVQSNAIFARFSSPELKERLQERLHFGDWDVASGEVRIMCSWATRLEDVEDFARVLREELRAKGAERGEGLCIYITRSRRLCSEVATPNRAVE